MASGDNSPPPSFSSGGSRSLEPENPSNYDYEYEYPTQSPSMSNMTPNIPSNTNFSTDVQRGLTSDYQPYVEAPNRSSVQHGGGSSVNVFTGAYDTRGAGQPDGGQAPEIQDALPDNRSSTTGFSNAYGDHVPAPSQSHMTPLNQSNPGYDDNSDQTYDQDNNVGYSIVGRNFKSANLMDPYDYNGIQNE